MHLRLEPLSYLFIYNTYVLSRECTAIVFNINKYIYILFISTTVESAGVCRTPVDSTDASCDQM